MITQRIALVKDCMQLIILITLTVDIQETSHCSGGWFGSKCQFLCHCSTPYCETDGECFENDTCVDGYFGPACQYLNLVYTDGADDNPEYLIDNNESTCNPDVKAVSVSVLLKNGVRFDWFRVHTKNQIEFIDYAVILNENEACIRKNTIYLEKIIDTVCHTSFLVFNLTIHGPLAPEVCSIYISGGRNVALKQNATQSSTFNNNTEIAGASNAVDGNVSGNVESKSCSSTSWNGSEEFYEWHLTFSQPQLLHRVKLYNAKSSGQQFLRGFILRTFDSLGKVQDEVMDRSEIEKSVYNVLLFSDNPVTSVIIRKEKVLTEYAYSIGLVLCEVQTFGETVCPDNTYGVACNKQCKCSSLQLCDIISGACLRGCPTGTYGSKCRDKCSETCAENKCLARTGHCLVCPPGYKGHFCTDLCPEGTFGDMCSEICPALCSDFGCDRINGSCIHCEFNRTGSKCEVCPQTSFGWDCSLRCPITCKDGMCNSKTGVCDRCILGFSGPTCDKSDTETSSYIYLWVAFPSVVIFLFLTVYMMSSKTWKTKRDSSVSGGGTETTYDTSD